MIKEFAVFIQRNGVFGTAAFGGVGGFHGNIVSTFVKKQIFGGDIAAGFDGDRLQRFQAVSDVAVSVAFFHQL